MSGTELWSGRLATLESRSYLTYKARLEACKRLEARARALNGLVVALSLSGLIAAGGMLRDRNLYGANGDVLWLFISILTFAGSLTSSSIGYGARSRNMFQNYRKLQRLSVQAETAKRDEDQCTREVFEKLNSEHDDLLDESENHTTVDFMRAQRSLKPPPPERRRDTARVLASGALSAAPWIAVAVPILLVIPAFLAYWP
ncbi:SLATT domain-containing protein [Knoellia locipacati]|uniref:SLATT domain-containing protein n=1 Tax=Knoellia locipacati TaxID=882824 RepID=UPI00384F77B7